MNERLLSVLGRFPLEGEPVSAEPYGCGHINATYLVTTTARRYILQKINDRIFRDVGALMKNIRAVTDHLRQKNPDPRAVLTIVPTVLGADWFSDASGAWRVYDFVEGSLCLQKPESGADFYESAVGFGRFQEQLLDFPARTLNETLPHFHDTPDRFRLFREAIARNAAGRAGEVQKEIEFCLKREEETGVISRALNAGALPLRVTHNDTKLNNILLDASTRRALCVIDLDTVMPGSALFDYGDSIRFGASTADESETDLARVTVDEELFGVYTRGFVVSCPGLTREERELLPLGAKTMTFECGMRFLTDYLDGDVYFGSHYEGQNLDRARNQFRLVEETERKWAALDRIAREAAR